MYFGHKHVETYKINKSQFLKYHMTLRPWINKIRDQISVKFPVR